MSLGVGLQRIVRDTHKEDRRLPHRLGKHFQGNRGSSVFKRQLEGDALITKYGLRQAAGLGKAVLSALVAEQITPALIDS